MREAAGEAPSLVNELTVLYPSFVLADKDLGQFHFYHAGVAKQRHIPDLSTDIPVNGSFLASNRVNCVSALVPAAMNDQLLLLFIELYLVDPLPLEAQNIPLDVDSHIPVLCEVSEALYTNRLRGDRDPFSLIEAVKSRGFLRLSN